MPDVAADLTPEELRATQGRIFATELGAWCRLIADNLAGSIEMTEERGEDATAARVKLEIACDYEAALAKRVHGRDMPRYEPRWPSRRGRAA
jgi:hypothetical protein